MPSLPRRYRLLAAATALVLLAGVGGLAAWQRVVSARAAAAAAKPEPTPLTVADTTVPPRGRQVYDYKPNPLLKAGYPLRPMDYEILEIIEKGEYKRTDLLDLFPQRPYQVKLVGSAVEHWISFVLIDFQRDGKWDEKWELGTDRVVRTTLVPGSPEAGVPHALRPGHWLPY